MSERELEKLFIIGMQGGVLRKSHVCCARGEQVISLFRFPQSSFKAFPAFGRFIKKVFSLVIGADSHRN